MEEVLAAFLQECQPREILGSMLRECAVCCEIFTENVALISDEEGHLTEEQMPSLIVYLNNLHAKH